MRRIAEPSVLATLRGEFGFSITGTRPGGPHGSIEAIVGVALTTFDDDGILTQVDHVHGSISGFRLAAVNRPSIGARLMSIATVA